MVELTIVTLKYRCDEGNPVDLLCVDGEVRSDDGLSEEIDENARMRCSVEPRLRIRRGESVKVFRGLNTRSLPTRLALEVVILDPACCSDINNAEVLRAGKSSSILCPDRKRRRPM
jgi:hypothetical protein